MKPFRLLAALFVFAGCGESPPEVPTTPQEYLTIVDLDGKQRVIPSGELIDKATSEPIARDVLVIDRHTRRKIWVPAKELLGGGPALARYIPFTQSEPGDAATQEQ